MSDRRGARIRLAALLAAAAVAGGAGAAELRERPLEVPEPGLYEVGLDAGDLARLTDAGGIEVVGPNGQRVPAARFTADRAERCRALEVEELERIGDRWRVGLRVPEGAGLHAALRFELEDAVLASDCTLEGRGGGRGWRRLARADLFRIGENEQLASTRFSYPATNLRELRLEWPAEAGFPRVRRAEVCAPRDATDAPRLAASVAPARRLGQSASRVRIGVPARALRIEALELELGAPATAGVSYRLRVARGGAWIEVARGRWPAGERRLRLEIGGATTGTEEVALDLHGPASELVGAEWVVAPQGVRFEARAPGAHVLRIPARAGSDGPGGTGATAIESGPPATVKAELRAPEPGAELQAVEFARRWPVTANAVPGEPVVVVLPPEVGATSVRAFADLRLSRAGRLVPTRWEPVATPIALGLESGLDPAAADGGWSRVEIGLPGAERAAVPSQLLVRAPVLPFERTVRVTELPSESLRRPVRARRLWTGTWRCAGVEPVPCELSLPLAAAGGESLRIEIEDGDSAPLVAIDVELLGGASRLLFLWPGDGVELFAGSSELGAARFDLAALDAALELAPPVTARLGPSVEAGRAGMERFGRWLLPAAVILVAVALLLLLGRLLPPARRAG